MDSPPPVNVGTGSSSQPDKKTIEDLHYKYLFFMTTLDNSNLVGMMEEEKRLFAFANTYKQYVLKFDLNSLESLEEFQAYTRKLMQNVIDNYLGIFKDKSLDITGFVDETDSNDFILKSFRTLQVSLQSITQSSQPLYYITCVLVCSALLFLVRTTKRSLFMYLSQQKSGNNASRIPNVVKAVISNAETKDVNIKDKLASVILYVSEFVTSIQQIVSRTAAALRLSNTSLKNVEQRTLAMIKQLQDCTNEKDALKKELAEQLENMQKLQNEEGKKAMMEKLASKTKELQNNLSGIMQLASNFEKLFKRWDENTTNKEIVAMKMKSLNEINNPSHPDNAVYKSGLEILLSKVEPTQPSFAGNLKNDINNIIITLVNALLQLGKEKVIMQPDGLEMFFGGSDIYGKLVLLYEELSGAVRAVVRVRDVYATNSMSGGKKRKTSATHQSLPKRRRLLKGGSINDETRFKDYTIQLDKKNKLVEFVGIDPNDKVFKSRTLRHGPFFSVHNNTLNDDNATSVEDDLLRGIGFDSLVNMFNQGTSEKDKEPAIILYTYGYSGSGKSYTLFGEKTQNSVPKAGVVWEIVRKLQANFDLKLVNTTVCYGYLDYENNGYVFKTNPPKTENKNSTDVAKWANIINSDFANALQIVNDDSFIKATPNNPESSRGFYIVKIALYEKGSSYRSIKGYIGVVDMAGNEDPFDIATTICPTMRFEKMDTLLKEPQKTHEYDLVYEEIKNALVDILQPTILQVLTLAKKGYITDESKKAPASKVLSSRLIAGKQNILITLAATLQHSILVAAKKANGYQKVEGQYIRTTQQSQTHPYMFDYVNEKTNIEFRIMEVPKNGKVKFHISAELIQELCIYIQQKYLETTVSFNKDGTVNEDVTVNDIREAIIKGENEKVALLRIRYAVNRMINVMAQKKGTTVLSLYIRGSSAQNDINQDRYSNARNKILTAIVDALESTNNNIMEDNKIIEKTKPYLLPFVINGKLVEYSYSTIARIIKEGYYINKANAELMDYFKKKLHMQDTDKLVQVIKAYDFNKSFAFIPYNKFARDFVPVNGNSNTNSTKKDFEYDTGLVDIIKKQFPGKNKDIIFACVRNDKDFGKILGAIDTLELIRDLKST